MKQNRLQKQQRTKARILKAARELAQENGFENLSLRAIARRVDYSPASLYEYFANKDAIIDALCEETEHRLAAHMQLNSDLDLINMAVQYIEFAKEFPDDFQLVYRRPMLPNQDEKVPYVLRKQAQKDIDSGRLIDCTAEDVAYALWAMAHGIALLTLNRELYEKPTRQIQSLRRLLSSFQKDA
jgi:AcrR family transcriptional regulator